MEEPYTLYLSGNKNSQAPAANEAAPDLAKPIPYARPELIENNQAVIFRQFFLGQDVYIDLCAYSVKRKPVTVYAVVKRPTLLFSYLLGGQKVNLRDHEKRVARLFDNQYAANYLPAATYRLKLRKGTYWTLNFAFTLRFLVPITNPCPILNKFTRSLDTVNPTPRAISPGSIDFSVKRVISKLQKIRNTDPGEPFELLLTGQLMKLLMHYESQLQSGKPVKFKSTCEKAHDAREFIENNYTQRNCRVSRIVPNFNTSRKTLTREYKKEFGINMQKHIIQLRMKRAAKLLEENNLIKDVTTAVGYENPYSFSRMFKKYYGYPPQERKPKH